jgi:glutamyl-tRNA synthetase
MTTDTRDIRQENVEEHRLAGIQPARVRFAPSPTGFLHLGGLRTALFNWLYARQTGGQFILRIEDTDQTRYNPESLTDLMAGLRWLGLEWDEGPDKGGPFGPYVQSERQAIYARYAEELIAGGHAYRCYCTSQELETMREAQRAQGIAQGYDRRCRNLTAAQRAELEAAGRSSVVRLAVPLDGTTVVHDLVRGDIAMENAALNDPIMIKSDGMPTYHFAVVVDDHLMEITHIIRGDDWISSAAQHRITYDAFGWEMPVLVHLPVILDPSGKGKMSKRKTVVAGKEYLALVHEFIEAGYLPEAMFNFLTNVGWNYDPEQEVFTREQAIARFDLHAINPTAAALPYPKLEWINGVYIREMDPVELQQRLAPFLAQQLGLDEAELRKSPRLAKLVPLVRERIKLLSEAWDKVDWAFVEADAIQYGEPQQLVGKGLSVAESLAVLQAGRDLLGSVAEFDAPHLEEAFRAAAEAANIKLGSYFAPFRVAITGRTVSPPLFESMEVLGRAETQTRIDNAMAALQNYAEAKV